MTPRPPPRHASAARAPRRRPRAPRQRAVGPAGRRRRDRGGGRASSTRRAAGCGSRSSSRTTSRSATSSRSSRLIHGGLRYLQQLEVPLVREALAERARLLRLAPHLVRLEAFLFPLYGAARDHARVLPGRDRRCTTCWEPASRAAGTATSTLGGHARLRAGPRRPTASAASLALPRRDGGRRAVHARGGAHGAQARFGQHAVAVTRVRATAPVRAGSRGSDPIAGATVEDRLTGATFDDPRRSRARRDRRLGRPARSAVRRGLVRGRSRRAAPPRHPARPDPGPRRHDAPDPRPRRVPRPVAAALDRRHDGHAAHGAASTGSPRPREDVDEILGTLNGALDLDLTRDDLVGTYAGLRPLIAPSGTSSTVKVSREHRVSVEAPGPRPGERRQVHDLPGDGPRRGRCRAGHRRGPAPPEPDPPAADPRRRAARRPRRARGPPRDAATGAPRGRRHARSSTATGRRPRRSSPYGAGTTSSGPSSAGAPYLEAEIAWAADRELAQSLDDLLARRIRLVHTLPDRGESIAPRVAADRRPRARLGRGSPGGGGRDVPRGRPPGVRNPGLTGASTPPDEGQRRDAKLGIATGTECA